MEEGEEEGVKVKTDVGGEGRRGDVESWRGSRVAGGRVRGGDGRGREDEVKGEVVVGVGRRGRVEMRDVDGEVGRVLRRARESFSEDRFESFELFRPTFVSSDELLRVEDLFIFRRS